MYYTSYHRKGNNIFIRYKKPGDSTTYSKKVDFYKPSLFTLANAHPDSKYKDIYSNPLKKIEFENIAAAKNFAQQYKDTEIGLNGNSNYENQFIIELFEGKQPEYEESNIKIGYLDIEVDSPDEFPHPDQAKHPINAVTIYNSVDHTFYVFVLGFDGCGEFDISKLDEIDRKKLEHLKIEYFQFEKETNLVRSFLQHISDHGYDCVSGYNSEGFDIPYIINRSYQLLGENQTKKLLSPFNMIDKREFVNDYGKECQTYTVIGLPHLDYMQMYKKHVITPRESYSLNFIAQEELGEKKLSYDEEKSLSSLYRNNFTKFIAYNIIDVDLIVRLDQKLGLFGLVYAMSYYSLSNFEDTMGTVKIWEQLIAKFLYTKDKVPLFRRPKSEQKEYAGAYVKEPIPGAYDWLVSYDLNSLYPHIEQQWNIGPETIIKDLPSDLQKIKDTVTFDELLRKEAKITDTLKKYNCTMTPNKEFYKIDKMSFFSEIKRELYAERKAYKKKMLEAERNKVNATDKKEKKMYEFLEAKFNNLQMGLKILLNGGYGAVGNKSFLYYMVENAEAITLSGQLVNMYVSSNVDKFLNDIFNNEKTNWIYSDTDSCYITIKPFVDTLNITDYNKKIDTIDRFCKELIAPKFKEYSEDMASYLNCYENRMFWEREVIADRGIWLAKKKYVMSVLDSEGTRYKEPKIKITGMESVKASSYPKWSRQFLKEVYTIGLHKDEEHLFDHLDKIKEEFNKLDASEISIPTGINGISKYSDGNGGYIKGTGKHVKAAINYNNMVDKLKLTKLQKIEDGTKIKYIQLKMPNPTGEETIAFYNYLPEEFGLEDYIDRNAIYEKSFMSPLRIFIAAINWREERTVDLFSF